MLEKTESDHEGTCTTCNIYRPQFHGQRHHEHEGAFFNIVHKRLYENNAAKRKENLMSHGWCDVMSGFVKRSSQDSDYKDSTKEEATKKGKLVEETWLKLRGEQL